jgi:hypothetical protein
MSIDRNTTIAQAWADDRARLLATKDAMVNLKDSLDLEVDLYLDADAKNTARHLLSDFSMKFEQIDRVVARLDELLA